MVLSTVGFKVNDSLKKRRGEVRYFLLHHGGCPRSHGFHYRVTENGVENLLAESIRGQHPMTISIQIEGNFDAEAPANRHLTYLKILLLELKLRYPSAAIGGHRQIQRDTKTTCPGRKFPLSDIVRWSNTELLKLRDASNTRDIEAQYTFKE